MDAVGNRSIDPGQKIADNKTDPTTNSYHPGMYPILKKPSMLDRLGHNMSKYRSPSARGVLLALQRFNQRNEAPTIGIKARKVRELARGIEPPGAQAGIDVGEVLSYVGRVEHGPSCYTAGRIDCDTMQASVRHTDII